MVARVVIGLLAVAVLAWLAVLERDQRLLVHGTARSRHATTPALVARAGADLRAARTLNPDRTADIIRSFLLLGHGRPGHAAELALSVARAQPGDVVAWAQVLRASGRDPALSRLALDHVRRLDPISARRLR